METTGQSLRRLLGWSPRTYSWADPDGYTVTEPEPELDVADTALLGAWMRLRDDLCECGRPLELHEDADPASFRTGYRTCPALAALDQAQAARRNDSDDKRAREDGLDPERSRTWLVWTDAEGQPKH